MSTYAPRRCGIATFTQDLANTVGEREIVALQPPSDLGSFPGEVRHRIRREVAADYSAVARTLNDSRVDVVSIQHAFSIWGGVDGALVLDFMRALRLPTVATLHGVPRTPTPSQHRILVELVDQATATVVMSGAAAAVLSSTYGIDPVRLDVIPHGVPNLPLVDPGAAKAKLGLAGHEVILSLGLLAPGKGYESVIAAMPAIALAHPSVRYVILGVTHPDVLQRDGEAYRDSLVSCAAAHGVAGSVQFVDRFVGRVELATWLQATDIFVTPDSNLDLVGAGTLSLAMGAGKAIISTRNADAAELLARGRGRLVSGTPAALAQACVELLGDPILRAGLGRQAYDHGRRMIWPEVGMAYRRVFERVLLPRVAPSFRPSRLAIRGA